MPQKMTSTSSSPITLVSVVIPVYNEEESLPELLRRTRAACAQLTQACEIILIDDGSRDASAQLMQAAAEEPQSQVVAVILNRNYGQHSAIMAGFEQARGDLIITLDADLQNPPEEIPKLVAAAEQGYDVVFSKFFYLAAPNAADDSVIAAMNAGLSKVMENETLKTYAANALVNLNFMTPEETETYYKSQDEIYAGYLKDYIN